MRMDDLPSQRELDQNEGTRIADICFWVLVICMTLFISGLAIWGALSVNPDQVTIQEVRP